MSEPVWNGAALKRWRGRVAWEVADAASDLELTGQEYMQLEDSDEVLPGSIRLACQYLELMENANDLLTASQIEEVRKATAEGVSDEVAWLSVATSNKLLRKNHIIDPHSFKADGPDFYALLHLVSVISDMFFKDVTCHGSTQLYPEVRALTETIEENLAELYQVIGNKRDC